ncbi:hypothetical protein CBS101457_000293 [Exobasidium rhododendri]|nr:hypothetical protein CBS101457_000293 [Exobasidium rhododendri]
MEGELARLLNLSTAMRPKPVATPIDLAAVLRAAYTSDKIFRLAEDRVAFTATLKLMAYTASRPGELVASAVTRDSPDALRWRDIEFMRTVFANPEDGSLGSSLFAKVTLRLLKGKRDNDSHFKSSILMMDSQNPILCPLLDLLALAHTQGILEASLDAIINFSLANQAPGTYTVPLKADKLSCFVFRKLQNSFGQVTATSLPATYDTFERRLTKLSFAANIDVRTTCYAFRRLAANAVNRPEVTQEDRRLLMGHSITSTVFRAYIARTTQVDVQGLITKGQEERLAIQSTSRLSRGFELPKAVSVQGRASVFARDEVKAITADIKIAHEVFARKNLGISINQARIIKQPDAALYYELLGERRNLAVHLLKATYLQEISAAVRQKNAEAFSNSSGTDNDSSTQIDEAVISKSFETTVDARVLSQEDCNSESLEGFETLEYAQDLDLGNIDHAPLSIEERFGIDHEASYFAEEEHEEDEGSEGEIEGEEGEGSEAENQQEVHAGEKALSNTAESTEADFDTTLIDPRLLEGDREHGDTSNDTTLVAGEEPEQVAEYQTGFQRRRAIRTSLVRSLLGEAGEAALPALELIPLMLDSTLLGHRPVIAPLSDLHPEGGCGICGAAGLNIRNIVPHRMHCARQGAIAAFIRSSPLVEKLFQHEECPLKVKKKQVACHKHNSSKPYELAQHIEYCHIKKHLTRGKGVCPMPSCDVALDSAEDVRVHLEAEHLIIAVRTRKAIETTAQLIDLVTQQCQLCSIYVFGRAEWRNHCAQHREEFANDTAFDYVPQRVGATTTRPGLCPWCLHNKDLRAEDAVMLFNRIQGLRSHVQAAHLVPLLTSSKPEELMCPCFGCHEQFASIVEVGNHLVQRHEMMLFGQEPLEAGSGYKLWDGKQESLHAFAYQSKSQALKKRKRRSEAGEDEAEEEEEEEEAEEGEEEEGEEGEEEREQAGPSRARLR